VDRTGRDEAARVAAVRRLGLLDTPADPDFDDIAALAARACGTPIALISLIDVDRQWFKARVGVAVEQLPRAMSICAVAMFADEVFVVPDALADARYADHPLVTGGPRLRFYAGVPLHAADGQPAGTLCVMDHEPRRLTDAQTATLRNLARHAQARLELAGSDREIAEVRSQLTRAHAVADEFAALVRHELRTPLTSIRGYLELLTDPAVGPALNTSGLADAVARNSDKLLRLVDDLLLLAQLDATSPRPATVDLAECARAAGFEVSGSGCVRADPVLMKQALTHLLAHATAVAPGSRPAVSVDAEPPAVRLRGVPLPMLATGQPGDGAAAGVLTGGGVSAAIVRAIVGIHGGTITALPGEPGVRITLPAPA